MSGQSACDICDYVFANAFDDVGGAWERGELSVYRERRSCEITLKALHDLRLALREPRLDAPLAIGGALEHDPYRLPTTMVEIVLREAGWRATSLGAMLPVDSLSEALGDIQPDLLWLSVTSTTSIQDFLRDYARVQETATTWGTLVVVGGQALTEEVREQMAYSAYCDNLRHLIHFVTTLTNGRRWQVHDGNIRPKGGS